MLHAVVYSFVMLTQLGTCFLPLLRTVAVATIAIIALVNLSLQPLKRGLRLSSHSYTPFMSDTKSFQRLNQQGRYGLSGFLLGSLYIDQQRSV